MFPRGGLLSLAADTVTCRPGSGTLVGSLVRAWSAVSTLAQPAALATSQCASQPAQGVVGSEGRWPPAGTGLAGWMQARAGVEGAGCRCALGGSAWPATLLHRPHTSGQEEGTVAWCLPEDGSQLEDPLQE